MKNRKKNQGITLVALIVTIIILLILAGVTIALLSGEDGILARTEKAATSYQTESIKEVVNLKLANLNASKWIDEGRRANLKDLNEFDDENSQNFDAEITLKNQVQDLDISAILIYDKHEIEVDSLLNIDKVDGEKTEGTSGGSSSSNNGSTSGGNSSEIDLEEYQQMQTTIVQLQQRLSQLEMQTASKEEVDTLKSSITNLDNDIKNNYATIEYANALPQNSGNYTDLTWTLLDSTSSNAWVKSNANIDDYNYICVTGESSDWGLVNPVIMSVKQFKTKCNSASSALYSGRWNMCYFAAYYDSGLYMSMGSSADVNRKTTIYGLK